MEGVVEIYQQILFVLYTFLIMNVILPVRIEIVLVSYLEEIFSIAGITIPFVQKAANKIMILGMLLKLVQIRFRLPFKS